MSVRYMPCLVMQGGGPSVTAQLQPRGQQRRHESHQPVHEQVSADLRSPVNPRCGH